MRRILYFFTISLILVSFQLAHYYPGAFLAIASDMSSEKEALYYNKLENNQVMCTLCPRKCIIAQGNRGFCRVRENIRGTLYSIVYSKPCALNVDPVEKKPLFHVLPGTASFSVATAGCNMACKFCQNWQISQASPEDVRYRDMTPRDIVEAARLSGSATIAYTYTEPTVFYEYMLDIAKLARQQGILNVMVSSGFINEEPLRRISRYIDAANIDLKGSDKFYTEICLGTRADVLRSLKILKQEGVWVEVTYLLIPTLNDSKEYIKETALWIKENLGPDTPLHISRFWPLYKLINLSPTPMETLYKARDIALASGLNYVYIGNAPGTGAESTYCPHCKGLLIKRMGYNITEKNIEGGKCIYCKENIAGIWEKR